MRSIHSPDKNKMREKKSYINKKIIIKISEILSLNYLFELYVMYQHDIIYNYSVYLGVIYFVFFDPTENLKTLKQAI